MRQSAVRVLPLVSSQGKYPRGIDPWVGAVQKSIRSLDPDSTVVLSSLGLPGWDLVSILAMRAGLSLELVLPGEMPGVSAERELLERYGLGSARIKTFWTGGAAGKDSWGLRDTALFAGAQRILPLSLRPGGRLERLLENASDAGAEVDRSFSVPWSARNWRPRYEFTDRAPDPETDRLIAGKLIHWTVASSGPWPGEFPESYYNDLLADPGDYVRDAPATLARIIRERLVRGSAVHLPGRRPGVSLSSLAPSQALSLMRWRMRYVRYTIEPFGVALERTALEALGAQPVRYLRPDEPRPEGEEAFFTQGLGTKTLWSQEREWRFSGDLSLSGFGRDQVVLLAADPESAGELAARTDYAFRVLSLFKENVRCMNPGGLDQCLA